MTNRSQRLRTPEQIARKKRRKAAVAAGQALPRQTGAVAQMTHASSARAEKKRREGTRRMEREWTEDHT